MRGADKRERQAEMITAILFDLYETLVTEGSIQPVRASSLWRRLGLDEAAFRQAWTGQRPRIIRGQVSFADALIEIGARLGQTPHVEQVRSISDERRREKAAVFQRVGPNTVDALRDLRGKGLRLGVISNCFPEDMAGWSDCSAAQYVHTSVFSCEVGMAKPEAAIYLEALRRLGVTGSTAVFIGDGGDDELPGAERAGVRSAQATWYRGESARLPKHIPRLGSWSDVLRLAAAG